MKRILSIIISLFLIISLMVPVSADNNENPERIMVFGDSVMAGFSYKINHAMGGLPCGDQQFLALLAQEYGLTYSSGDSYQSTDKKWLMNKSISGSVISPSDVYYTTNQYINGQIEKVPNDYFKVSDVIIVDGGLNDLSATHGIHLSNNNYYYSCGLSSNFKTCSLDEAKAQLERIKAMNDEEAVADAKAHGNNANGICSWATRRGTIKQGYQKVVDNLTQKGFTGTLYLQNNINAHTGGEYENLIYYWDEIINYFVTSVIKDVINENASAPFKIVLDDICGNCRNGYKYTGVNYFDGAGTKEIGDPLHLTYEGNQAVYKYLSKLINPNGNTLNVYTDETPKELNYRTLYSADTIDFYRAIGADKVSVDELKAILDDENETSIVSNSNVLKSNGSQKGIIINLAGLNLSKVYGIQINFVSQKGSNVKTMIDISNKDENGNEKKSYICEYNGANTSMASKNITVNSPIGIPDSVYKTTQAKIADIQNIQQLNIYSVDTSNNYVEDTIYIDSIKIYTTLEQFQVDQLTSEQSPTISMHKGASMRLFNSMNDECGIRFYTKVDTERIQHIIDAGFKVEIGTLIAPKDKINDELKFNDENDIHKYTTDYVVIPFDISKGYYSDNNAQNCVVGSLISIKDKNANRDFVGRGYLVYSKNGETTVEYADYYDSDISNNSRSISYLSNCVKNDLEYYNSLSTAKQNYINYWINIVNK